MADPDLGELQRLVRGWLDRHYPAWRGCSLRADVGETDPLTLPITRSAPLLGQGGEPARNGELSRDTLPELRGLILDALAEAERPLKAVLIARHCGRKYDGHFRRTMRELCDGGEVIHDRQEKTFRLPDDL